MRLILVRLSSYSAAGLERAVMPPPPCTRADAVAELRGADGDVEVRAAVEADVADGAAVDAARGLLDLRDDLHGADLGRAGDRAAGEGGAR